MTARLGRSSQGRRKSPAGKADAKGCSGGRQKAAAPAEKKK